VRKLSDKKQTYGKKIYTARRRVLNNREAGLLGKPVGDVSASLNTLQPLVGKRGEKKHLLGYAWVKFGLHGTYTSGRASL